MQTLIATPTLLPKAAKLAQMLWPHHSAALLEAEWQDYLDSGGTVLLAMENGQPIGFAQCSLRHDYVEGTSSSPVGYLEGIFVLPEYPPPRHRPQTAGCLPRVDQAAGLPAICQRLYTRQRRQPALSSGLRLCRGKPHHLLRKAAVALEEKVCSFFIFLVKLREILYDRNILKNEFCEVKRDDLSKLR